MKPALPILAILLSALLAGCATDHAHTPAQAAPALAEAARRAALAGADWSTAQKISIELRDYGFHPRELTLRRGQAYRLHILNTGGNTHYLNAPEFFRTIAANKVEVPNMAEIRANDFTQFEIFRRGGEIEFEFVPLVSGRYRAHCHLEGHAAQGVEGFLNVE